MPAIWRAAPACSPDACARRQTGPRVVRRRRGHRPCGNRPSPACHGRRQRLALLEHPHRAPRADPAVEPVEDRRDRDALGREDVVGAELVREADALPELSTGGARPVEVQVAARRRGASASRRATARPPARSMKFMLLAITSRCLGAAGARAQVTQLVAHMGDRTEVDLAFHADQLQLRALGQRRGASAQHDERPLRRRSLSKPITRIDGSRGAVQVGHQRQHRAEQDRHLEADRHRGQRAWPARSPKSCRLQRHRRCQPGRSNSDQATTISSPAIAGERNQRQQRRARRTAAAASSEENTAASGVRAPASRFGIERFSEPQDT